MIQQDFQEKERNNAKNAVEEDVYYYKHKLEGPYQTFLITEDHQIVDLLIETENWLYDEEADQDRQTYHNKLDELFTHFYKHTNTFDSSLNCVCDKKIDFNF